MLRLPFANHRPNTCGMRILFLGDVMGRGGRQAVAERLPGLRRDWRLDFVVVNGENATGGRGLSAEHAKGILEAGADVITLGDHAFDQKDMMRFCETEPRIIRPLNYAKHLLSIMHPEKRRTATLYETQIHPFLVNDFIAKVPADWFFTDKCQHQSVFFFIVFFF